MDFTPIETEYRGDPFRSRTEARFAVCFYTLGIRYIYELEGFEFAGGIMYLPDFYLPDLDLWLEVKGTQPTPMEFVKATLLAQAHPKTMVVISWENFDDDTAHQNIVFWHDDDGVFLSKTGHRWLANPERGWRAARLERFESQRKGLPWCEWGKPKYGELPY